MTFLGRAIDKELKERLFLYLPEADLRLHQNPLDYFPKAREAFSRACPDMIGAYRCHTLSQSHACVFHCMGILQEGLYFLAQDVGVQFNPNPIELEIWKNILDRIEAQIGIERDSKKKSTVVERLTQDERLQFLSEAAVQFIYFKDAWRNHVCHFRSEYDSHQAMGVLAHVRDFMELLSSRLRQEPT